MRELDRIGQPYTYHLFECSSALSGIEVAELVGENPDHVFKTLVTVGKSGEHYVFMVPVAEELDLKKAAGVVGEKSIHMVKSKELLGLTGYIHGGCSPLGMKKRFVTTIDETAQLFDTIIFSPVKLSKYLTNSHNTSALFALNVAISRLKKELIIVCSYHFWIRQHGQLIASLLHIATPYPLHTSLL